MPTAGDADIGVPAVELIADPGALENERVLTADVEADVVCIGESGLTLSSLFSAVVTGDAPGRVIDGISTSASKNCRGV